MLSQNKPLNSPNFETLLAPALLFSTISSSTFRVALNSFIPSYFLSKSNSDPFDINSKTIHKTEKAKILMKSDSKAKNLVQLQKYKWLCCVYVDRAQSAPTSVRIDSETFMLFTYK